MNFSKLQLDKKLGTAHVAIEGARRKPAIMEAIKPYQYDDKRLAQGMKLVKSIEEISVRWLAARYAGVLATEELKIIRNEIKIPYGQTRRVARMITKNDAPQRRALGLDQPTQRSLPKWLEEARQFYTNALKEPAILEKFSKFGITAKRLRNEKKMLEKIEKAMANQEKKAAEAMKITLERKKTVKELEQFMSEFYTILRIALGNSQLLEAVGITV
ncbi:MAG: hypothetical protein GY950_03230 [bacterium]|nr:hypothetical protein [bacterium]